MASIYENLTTIKENIDAMKEVLGVDSTTPLELVTKTIEEKIGSSVTIHNVDTLEDMNNIEANDGDVCVISETVYKPLQEDTVTDTFYFLKDVIEYPEPIITSPEGFYMGMFSPDESKFTFNIVINFMDINAGVTDMSNPQLQSATYMTLPPDGEPGRKYVRNTDMPPELINRVLKTPIPVSCVSGWTDYFSEFVSVEGKEITGIYIRKNSSWSSITDNQEIINLISQSLPNEGDPELEASFASLIDDSLGANCTKLPDDLTSIGDYAFENRENLALTKLPDGITSIGKLAFGACTNLALTELPSGLTSIKYGAFESCENLALIELPDSLADIEGNAFYGCTSLALTELSSSLISIGDYAFEHCSNLALTKLPDGLTNIGEMAFDSCANLALTELPDSLTNISYGAFSYCPNITFKELPATITIINSYVFQGCEGLTKLTLKGNITKINQSAFDSCTSLVTFVLPNVTGVPTLGKNVFKNTPIASGTGYIYVPDTLVDSFKSATNWSVYANQIKPISELEAN